MNFANYNFYKKCGKEVRVRGMFMLVYWGGGCTGALSKVTEFKAVKKNFFF